MPPSEAIRLSVEPEARPLPSRRDHRLSAVTLVLALAVAAAAFFLRHEEAQRAPAHSVEQAAVTPAAPTGTEPPPLAATPPEPTIATPPAAPVPPPTSPDAAPAPRSAAKTTPEPALKALTAEDAADIGEKPTTAPPVPEKPDLAKARKREPRRIARAAPSREATPLGNGPPIDVGDLPPLPSSGN